MTKEEATQYYKAIMGIIPNSVHVADLKADLRARHIFVHNCGVVPEGVDEDDFFMEVLETLSS